MMHHYRAKMKKCYPSPPSARPQSWQRIKPNRIKMTAMREDGAETPPPRVQSMPMQPHRPCPPAASTTAKRCRARVLPFHPRISTGVVRDPRRSDVRRGRGRRPSASLDAVSTPTVIERPNAPPLHCLFKGADIKEEQRFKLDILSCLKHQFACEEVCD